MPLLAAGATLQAQQQPPTYRTGTTLVEVDVIARDGKGRFVADLSTADFDVIEDGVPQEISAIYRVIGPADAAAGTEAPATALPAPPPQQMQRVLVFYFDHAHMAPGSLDRAKKAALEFLENNFRTGDVGGVLNGPMMVNNRLTSNSEELQTAVRSVKPSGDTGELTRELRQWPRFVDVLEAYHVARNDPAYDPGASTVLGVVTARACRDQPDQCRGDTSMVEAQVQSKATQLVSAAHQTAALTLRTLTALANGLAKLPGRKTVIMLTEGFFIEDSWGDLRDVVARAAQASVRIYGIDSRGLNRGSASSDIISAATPSQPELSAPSLGDINADAPNSLAVDTGGYLVRNENDFGKAFGEIDRDTSSYYILGFRTTKPADGKYHPITVRVKRSGIAVRARKGYFASPNSNSSPSPNPTPSPSPSSSPNPPPIPDAASPKPPAAAPAAAPAVPSAAAGPALAVRAKPRVEENVGSLEASKAGAATTLSPAVAKAAREGWDAYQRGDVKTARDLLRPVVTDPSTPPWARYVLGWAEYASTGYEAATVQWEQVRRAVPEFEAVYLDLADGYLQQKEFGKATSILRAAQKRWPKDVEVYNAIGVIQAGRGALTDAIKTFEEAVAVNASDATACYNLAKSLELRFVEMQRLRKISTQNVGAILMDRDRAVQYYQRVVALGGPNVESAKEGLKRLTGQ